MRFEERGVRDTEGRILAHSIRTRGGTLRKGHVLGPGDVAELERAGHRRVAVAELERGDLDENAAASLVAQGLASRHLSATGATTGRANLRAARSGLLQINRLRIDQLNRVDEAITLATPLPFAAIEAGKVAATVKIVTFGVPEGVVNDWLGIARRRPPAIRLRPFRPRRIALVQTLGPRSEVLDKTVHTLGARLRPLHCALGAERRCAHAAGEIASALRELDGFEIVLVLGASATVDRRDTVPRAVEMAGGSVERLGMPVDPGHLTLVGRLGDGTVLGLPGSARSPRLHGFDWLLQRLVAGVPITPDGISGMGVGGLLKDIPGRPVPRDPAAPHRRGAPQVAAVLLAAGQSRRMGRLNKMLADVDGETMIARAARTLLASRASPVIVVVGHEADRVRAALAGLDVHIVHNPDYGEGISASLRTGVAAIPEEAMAAVIALGDMPRVTAADVDALVEAFNPEGGATICVPTHDGKRGNPVLWGRRYFREISACAGDTGARHLVGQNIDQVAEVARPGPGVLLDFDTPEALGRAGARG